MPDKKRLLVLASTYPRWREDVEPGFVHELSRRMIDDFDVTVLCPHAKGAKKSEVMDGVDIRRYRYAPDALETLVNNGGINGNLKQSRWKLLLVPFFLVAQLLATVVTLNRLKPDVIHAHWIVPQGVVLCCALIFAYRVPFVLTSHGADLFTLKGSLPTKLKSWVLSKAAFVTVVSEPMKQKAIQLGAHPDKLAVMPMGVDFDKFLPSEGVARNPNEVLFVGRLVEKKGVSYLVRALKKIHSEIPEVRLTIIGSGPEEDSLRKMASELGLDKHVDFLGAKSQTELINYYRRAGLFVAPFIEAEDGDQEGLGLVTVEAIASGCHVIVGDVAAIGDLPIVTVNPRDSQSFADALIVALRKPDSHSSEALRVVFSDRFSWHRVSADYRSLLVSTGLSV